MMKMKQNLILRWMGYAEDEHSGHFYATGLAILGAKVLIVVLPVPAGEQAPA
jgi:hypothetical protein